MCGIAGIFRFDDVRIADRDLKKMGGLLAHRGPDDQGIWQDGRVGLVHRRLSILDLSSAGHQPMLSHDGSWTVTYNGELYNFPKLRQELLQRGHRFDSECDSEVVVEALAEWGTDAFRRFNGMWALAAWHHPSQTLLLSRDRFGVKPLFWANQPGRACVFASEVKALLGVFPEFAKPDPVTLAEFVSFGGLDWSQRSFFRDVVSIDRASWVRIDREGCVTQDRYWQFEDHIATRNVSSPVSTFRDLFLGSIQDRLRSDVPVGTCLSGGLDSSSIVSVAIKELGHPRMNAFSSMHEEASANEEPFIRAVAKDTGVMLHPVHPSASGMFEDLDMLLWHHERPSPTASFYSQWEVMKAASKHVKVVLDGQGADELLGGYTGYLPTYLKSAVRAGVRQRDVASLARIAVSYPMLRWASGHHLTWPAVKNRLPFQVRRALELVATHGGQRAPDLPSLYRDGDVRAQDLAWPVIPEHTGDSFRDLLLHQFFGVGLQTLLHYEDRNSMAFSVEARVPFTDDTDLVNFCLALPTRWKVQGYETKRVLRHAMKGTLIDSVRNRRRKLGFPTPLASWLREHRSLAHIWEREDFARLPFLNTKTVELALEQHLSGVADRSDLLFRALSVSRWHRIFVEDGGGPPG